MPQGVLLTHLHLVGLRPAKCQPSASKFMCLKEAKGHPKEAKGQKDAQAPNALFLGLFGAIILTAEGRRIGEVLRRMGPIGFCWDPERHAARILVTNDLNNMCLGEVF